MSLALLHQLVYPSPLLSYNGPGVPKSTSQAPNPFRVESQGDPDLRAVAPQGVDLQARLLTASSVKEFSGLQHMFVAALGSIAYCEPGDRTSRSLPLDDDLGSDARQTAVAWRAIQCTSRFWYINRVLMDRFGSGSAGSRGGGARGRRDLRNVL